MKKYVTTSLFVFWAITVAVLVAGFISYNNSQSITGSNVGSTNQTGGTVPGINSNTTQKTLNLTMTELAKHNSSQSCWLLISGKIYDVTSYLNQHPGNASTILPSCGTDATQAYATKGSKDRPHSSNATALLVNFFIGNLNQSIKTSSNTNTNNLANIVTTSTPTPTPKSTSIPVTTPITPPVTPNITLTLSTTELAKHNSSQSCWLLISGKIYDVTSYLNQHPGNASTILPSCGTDATQAYATKGGTGSHSSNATAILGAYYIGNLDQTVATTPTNPTSTPVPTPVVPSGVNRENDD